MNVERPLPCSGCHSRRESAFNFAVTGSLHHLQIRLNRSKIASQGCWSGIQSGAALVAGGLRWAAQLGHRDSLSLALTDQV